jgi:hypothetical protein
MFCQSREQFFLPTVGCELADQRAFLRVAAELFQMGLHVFHEPVLIKLARGVSSKVDPRFQKRLEKITQAFVGHGAGRRRELR